MPWGRFPPQVDRRQPLGDPYAVDRSTLVSCVVGGVEVPEVKEYTFSNDVLSLGDPTSVVVGDPNGKYKKKIAIGSTFELYMSDPNVDGGRRKRRLTGRVIKRQKGLTRDRGSFITLGAADIGWHLQSTPGPLWYQTKGKAWDLLLRDLLHASWKFQGVDASNLLNRKLNQGRAGEVARIAQQYKQIPPPFQVEAGEMIAAKLIHYAKRERRLLNVSADGFLQIWVPDYQQQVSYRFYLHDDERRTKNNIEEALLDESLDGHYSKVTCVGSIVNIAKSNPDSFNPNAGKVRGSFSPTKSTIDFDRHWTFSDGDQTDRTLCQQRAKWMYQRGQFDAWTYTITVAGHVQFSGDVGLFYAPDTMAYVEDSVNDVEGRFYVSAVKYIRRRDERGSLTQLTLKKPDLLAA